MKKIVLVLSFAFFAMTMSAVPARPGQWKTVKLNDGREVRVELCGDEHARFWRDADGNVYVEEEGKETYALADFEKISARAAKRRAAINTERMKRAARGPHKIDLGEEHAPYIGTKKGLIILVNFRDTKFQSSNNAAFYNRVANEEGFKSGNIDGSVRDYFKAQSGGQFILEFDVKGPVNLQNGYSYYGQNVNGFDGKPGHMVAEACRAIDNEVNFRDYDWDGDGMVEQIFVLYAGKGEHDGGGTSTVWAHQWTLKEAYGSTLRLDGVQVDTYACGNELNSRGHAQGIGTICHEFSHCLGLPDLYDLQYKNPGMLNCSVMCSGCDNGSGYVPCGYTSYEKWYCGWLDPIELKYDIDVKNMKPLSNGGEAYVIYNERNRNEYYLLENRQKVGWDRGLSGSGLLVLHVDFDKKVWAANEPNTTTQSESGNTRQRCIPVPADNSLSSGTASGDAYPNQGRNTTLSKTSRPATSLYNTNSDGTKYLNVTVSGITQNSDKTVSFKFKGQYGPTGIEDVSESMGTNESNVYDLNGRIVGTNESQPLQRGIYIQNGKKVIK